MPCFSKKYPEQSSPHFLKDLEKVKMRVGIEMEVPPSKKVLLPSLKLTSIQNFISCYPPVLRIEEYQRKGTTEIKQNLVRPCSTILFCVPYLFFVGKALSPRHP